MDTSAERQPVDVARSRPVDSSGRDWERDHAMTATGVAIPLRATAQRPRWTDLPVSVRDLVEDAAGSRVVATWSAGTGFTPGFASRLDLTDGRRVFVKAASSADDEVNGWPLSDAYREEARKLAALPSGIGAPPLLWRRDTDVDGVRWIVLCLEYVAGTPPRRPWRLEQLRLVLDKLAANATALTRIPASLCLDTVQAQLVGTVDRRLHQIRERLGDTDWFRTVDGLCHRADDVLAGNSIVHLDLRDDNVLIDAAGDVWFVDWNWPAVGAAWIDLVCLLISAYGDGIDADALLSEHPLTHAVPAADVDCLLAVLWSFWAVGRWEEVPEGSPHLRNHQAWYADVTQSWLAARLGAGHPSPLG